MCLDVGGAIRRGFLLLNWYQVVLPVLRHLEGYQVFFSTKFWGVALEKRWVFRFF
jgi:hypothetical protein